MIGKFLRGLHEAVTSPDDGRGSYDARLLPRFGWECSCGGNSERPGWTTEYGAKNGAEAHRLRKEPGHPMPQIVPRPAPGI